MMQWFVDDAVRDDGAGVPIGYPLAGAPLAVVGADGRPAPPGEVGELVAGGPATALGHWIDGRCVPEAFASPGGRVFRTGDLVRQRPDGLLERLGRKDRQVKIRGARVELEGVEAALRRHPQVRDVAALARADAAGGAMLVAYVVAEDSAPAGFEIELKATLREQPAALRPGRIYLTDAIPRLASSKLDVRAVAELDAAQAQAEAASRGREDETDGDRVTRAAAQAWREALGAPAPGPETDFFDAGGDSLNALTLTLALERALGLELPVTLIHEAPSFGALCAALRRQGDPGYVPLVLLKAGEGAPPVFFVHGVGGNVADLFPIARRMAYPGAVIGIQARGLAGGAAPHPTVEAMAACYLEAVKARQPSGPYHLCGYSFGGLVAFEMARRLAATGDDIGLVGLFDTTPSPLGWPRALWLGLMQRRLGRLERGAIAAPARTWPRQAWAAAARAADRLRDLLAQTLPGAPPPPAFLKSAPAAVLKVAASGMLASARYRPGVYPGELTLFTPAGRDPGLPPPQAIWRRHARAVTVVDTAGGHFTMLAAANAEGAAAALTRCLEGG